MGFLTVLWYPVVDDEVGGWAIATADKPVSQIDPVHSSEYVIGDFLSEEIARHICTLHEQALRHLAEGRS